LLRIDFPRMEIEHARTPIVAVDAPETPPEQRIRQQPEKSAPATWPVAPSPLHRGHRHFQQSGVRGDERETRRCGHPVEIMTDGYDAGAVAIACLVQLRVGPQRGGPDRPAWRAVAGHRGATDVFQQVLGAGDALAELAAAQVGQAFVAEAVARDFVPRSADVAHQRGKALGNPTEHEESGVDMPAREDLQYPPGVGLDPDRPARLIGARDAPFERRDLEI